MTKRIGSGAMMMSMVAEGIVAALARTWAPAIALIDALRAALQGALGDGCGSRVGVNAEIAGT